MTTTPPIPTRTRTRANAAAPVPVPSATPEMQQLACTVLAENGEMNAHKKVHDEARKKLYEGMKQIGLESFNVVAEGATPGTQITVTALVQSSKSTGVSTEKLLEKMYPSVLESIKKLPEDMQQKFFGIFGVTTQKAVTDHLGKLVASQCAIELIGNENVTVSAN